MLTEIKSAVSIALNLDLNESTICRVLHSEGFYRQKIRIIAQQREEMQCAKYAARMSLIKPEMLVFLDKTGCDRRNLFRHYAYSLCERPATSHKLLARRKRLNAIAFERISGILDCHIESEAVDGDAFYMHVQKYLLPHLVPFDGTNLQSIAMMDNASIHHVDGIVEMIQSVGAVVTFLPPYSPDYSPTQEAFSKLKTLVKQYDTDLEMNLEDIY